MRDSLRGVFDRAALGTLDPVTFLDLNWSVVKRHLERERTTRRSGPAAESILRDLGTVGAGVY